ncbi:alpha/beta hydrolase [Knoellia subterranea]|uniref:alpha/beta hydrolase n=1 Tax=Knoellia subterranea TaxID=184882 RepID=UPI000A4EC53E|nr:alpha/beta fold hydrolase [Knoellia subterranea]
MNAPTPSLTRHDTSSGPSAVILMLHGGKPRSHDVVDGRSASWQRSAWMARAITGRAAEAGAAVWLLRYRERGWNGGRDRFADARWALDEVRATHGGAPVILLGHSMGARVAVHVADDASVTGVVGLAPWWSNEDPVRTLQGRGLIAAHGRRDRITSFAHTRRFVERARADGARAELVDMGLLGHYMLGRPDRWNDVAIESCLRMLALATND